MCEAIAGPERRGEKSSTRTDRQRVAVAGESTGQYREASGSACLGNRPGLPSRVAATFARQQPDLIEPERLAAAVGLAVTNATARTHHLDLSRPDRADGAQRVAVFERPLADIRDDLHVAVPMKRKAGTDRNLVVIPDNQRAKRVMRGVASGIDLEVVLRAEPAMIGCIQ